MNRYVLKVYPKGEGRSIYRIIEISENASLDKLCETIIEAFDFFHEHMYEFCMDNKIYNRNPDAKYRFDADDPAHSTKVKLKNLNLVKKQTFTLHYDFGDDWEFVICVQDIMTVTKQSAPKVVKEIGFLEQYPECDEEPEYEWDDDDDEDDDIFDYPDDEWSLELPQWWKDKHKDERLQRLVAEDAMWAGLPEPTSKAGKKILDQNETLFQLAERLDFDYDFEPTFDGYFILIPETVTKQGLGITAGKEKDELEVDLYFYPCDFSAETRIMPGALLVPSFSSYSMDEMLQFANKYLPDETKHSPDAMAVIPLAADCMVTLRGAFIDHPDDTARILRNASKGHSIEAVNNAEALIGFIYEIAKQYGAKAGAKQQAKSAKGKVVSFQEAAADKAEAERGSGLKDGKTTPTPGFTLGMRLAYIRNEYALSKKKMAEIVDVSPATWSNYEADRTVPDDLTLFMICHAMEVNPGWLFENEGEVFMKR